MSREALAIALEAANRVCCADNGRDFREAVRHFRHVLSAMPDESLGPVTADDVHRLHELSDEVIEHIEEFLPQVNMLDARNLVDDIYQIRRLLEETARDRLISTVRHS
ncbi:MAG TPA: hypothetical protein VLV86_16825 [Vicinamibacterales bacterium]|nr:hypothetical protein [Vicinamibacterales bacterium]